MDDRRKIIMNLKKMEAILTIAYIVLGISSLNVLYVRCSPINQASNQQKNQILHPEEYYGSVHNGGFLDSNKIRSYDGANLVEANGNSKRARKISTFMPMRGRKDGNGAHGPGTTLDNIMNAYSIVPLIKMRLLDAATARQQQELLDEQQPIIFGDNEQQPQEQSIRFIGDSNLNRFVDMDEASQPGNSQSSQLIQNKLRRAFHPMRGKKSIMDEFTPLEGSLSDPLPGLVY